MEKKATVVRMISPPSQRKQLANLASANRRAHFALSSQSEAEASTVILLLLLRHARCLLSSQEVVSDDVPRNQSISIYVSRSSERQAKASSCCVATHFPFRFYRSCFFSAFYRNFSSSFSPRPPFSKTGPVRTSSCNISTA